MNQRKRRLSDILCLTGRPVRTVYQGNAFLFDDVQFVRVDCEDTQSLLLFLKYFYIHGFVHVSDNRRAEGVSGDVDSGSCHVEETVNAHNERDGFRRKADGSEDPLSV